MKTDDFVLACRKTWSGIKQEEFKNLAGSLGNDEIDFTTIMKLVKGNIDPSRYLDIAKICGVIAKYIAGRNLSMEQYLEEVSIKSEDSIQLDVYMEKVTPPFKLRKKEAYCLYYDLMVKPETYVQAAVFIEKIETIRQELLNKAVGPLEQVESVFKSSLNDKPLPLSVVEF